MASTCSSPLTATKKHDVFISFRGDDTRVDFTSHLHAALRRNNIETYIDYRIRKGQDIWVEIVKAIKESTLLLVIFSENYACSSWCLNELVQIMECKKQGEDVDVIPVFYRIDPSHVRNQRGSYHTAFTKHDKDLKLSKEKLQRWKDALSEAAKLSGFDSQTYRTESDMIEDIIKVVLQNLKYTNDFKGTFIYDENYTNIESLLKIDSKEVRVIGIWGMGGIGKTTLAAAVFYKVCSQYEGTCFLENVAEESKRHGLNYLRNKLLSKLLKEDIHIDTLKVIPSTVTTRLSHKKVFIVLDDVNTSELLENLVVGREWVGAGSRVIVTTRDKHLLAREVVDKIHEVKKMNFQKSLQLFSLHAFGKTYPGKGYEELSEGAMFYAKGIPLALKVLGSFLRSRSENEWDSALRKLKKIPNTEIQAVLRLSYEGLDDDEKNIFLDIACFFKGQRRDQVTKILNDCDFSADIGIRSLLDKALITITSYSDCIDMHDLIQEMGREVVRKDSNKNPGQQRSRLWDPKEVYDVLTNNTGTDAVEGIWLDVTESTSINLSSKAFGEMPKLRLLAFQSTNGDLERINSVNIRNGLESLPNNLRYLRWNGYPLESLPSSFCPEKLVELSMPYSNLEKLWHDVQNFPNLERVELLGSKHLKECPKFPHAPNLKYVSMRDCESLPDVDPSIFSLPKLEILNVSGCTSLKSLTSNIWPPTLRVLFLAHSGLNELPSSILHIRNLRMFSFLINCSLADLPENFADGITLSESTEHECDAFFTLHKLMPTSGFQSLTRLVFYNCQSLYEIPDNISLLSSLEYLSIRFSVIITLPERFKYLPRLKFLEIGECEILQHIPALPQSIQIFYVWNCQSLQTVLSSTIESSKRPKYTFLLPNCLKLDEDSYDAILKEAIVRIERGTKLMSAVVFENEEDASLENENDDSFFSQLARNGKICYCLQARSGKVQDWFHCHFTQTLVTIELPPNILGFIFYLVVSQVQSCHNIGHYGSIGCECYLESSLDERINISSFFIEENALFHPDPPFEVMEDHIFLWYDAQCCKQIMEIIKGRKTINDKNTIHHPKLTFKFFTQIKDNNEAVVIKECGFRWMYSLEEVGCKSKRSREIHEVEANVVRNEVEKLESNEQEETFPPTKKLKQRVFGTSNFEAEETEDLRRLIVLLKNSCILDLVET